MKRPTSDERTMTGSLCLRQDILQAWMGVGGVQLTFHPPSQRKEPNGVSVAGLTLHERMFMVLLFLLSVIMFGDTLYIGEEASQFPGKCSIV